MASPELAIAKATLSATLFRADPESLERPAVDAFFPLLDRAAVRCDRTNVQKCRLWIQQFIWPSAARTTALAKYLAALSKGFQGDGEKPSPKRRRLHLLYVLNDLLYHVIIKKGDEKFAGLWDGLLPVLVASAASFNDAPKHKKKLENLIAIWEEQKYFTADFVSKLRDVLTNGSVAAPVVDPQPSNTIKLAKDAPFILPSSHGDFSTPWYDLPAATWLPHLTPNSTRPMVPDLIKPIRLASGPAEPKLVAAVQNLLSNVSRLYSKGQRLDDGAYSIDIDELGQRIVVDDVDQETVAEETYYGWSRRFCEKMKQRKNKSQSTSRGRSASRSSIDSRGSSSPPAFKRRRLSTNSRDDSPPRRHLGRYSRSPSCSRSRSRSPARRQSQSPRRRSYSPSRSRSRSRSRPYHRSRSPPRSHPPAPPPPQSYPHPPPFPPVPPPGEFPLPPPPPGGYQGPWPPLPPPPVAGYWFPNQNMIPQMMGGWAPPPSSGQNDYGRGNGGYRGRGRGGYDRGRGW